MPLGQNWLDFQALLKKPQKVFIQDDESTPDAASGECVTPGTTGPAEC